MRPSARLRDLGITLPAVPTPAGIYVPATRHGDVIYTSGQLPLVDGELTATGIVGSTVQVDNAVAAARIAALNAVAAAAQVAGGVDHIQRIIKVTGYVASAPDFTQQPAVINGASTVLGEIFGDAGAHVRAAVGVASLPLNAAVEVEIVVAVA